MKPLAIALFLLSINTAFADVETARRVLDESKTMGGLVVHVGCSDGSLAVALAQVRENLVVHGLDSDPADVARARNRFREGAAPDRLSAELWTRADHLPYAENLVNLLVVDEGESIDEAEAMRILAPGGTVVRKQDGDWNFSRKPDSGGVGEWTHYQFDASNNMVGDDPDCDLPRRFQWTGKPLWTTSHENMASVNAMVSSKGRVFYIIDEGPRASIQLPADWQLVARDAYNGVILWKKPIEQWLTRYWPWKSGPAQMPRKLIAIGDRVYSVLDINGPLLEFDAATGEVLRTFEGTEAAEEFIYTDGILLVQVNPDPSNQIEIEAERRARRHFSYDGRNRVTIDYDKAKRIVAIRADTGDTIWSHPGPRILPLTLGAKNGNVIYHNGEKIVCLDLKTGVSKWASEPITGRLRTVAEEAPTTVIDDEVAFFAWNRKTTAISMADGKTLWTTDWVTNDYRSPVSVMVMHDLVWAMNITGARAPGTFTGRDMVTGEIVKQFDLPPFQGIGHHRCYKAKASGDYVLLSRSGVEYVDPAKESYDEHHWIRGACLYGIMPANGMLYSTPHACACYIKGKLNGFTAMTPGPTEPLPPAKIGEGPTEKGGAYGAAVAMGGREGDWPTYRGNPGRSGRNPVAVTSALKESWETEIGGYLTSVIVGGGLVFVAQKDRNTVHALRADDGATVWSYTAGGTVDSPPTLYAGRVYFGSADGSVYCLRAEDGALAWRTRAAPEERRVIAYGRVESAWPVSGSVLVQGGAVFCAAGRSSFLDGGIRIVKFDAETGKVLMSRNVYDLDSEGVQPPLEGSFDMAGALSDVLSGDGANVFMRHLGFDREILEPQEPKPHLFSPTGYLDANWWHRTYWVYGKDTKVGYGGWWKEGNKLPAGRLMVFDDEHVYAFGRSFYAGMNAAQFGRGEKYILYGAEKREGEEPDWDEINKERRRVGDLNLDWQSFRTTPIRWSDQLAFHVRGMALADRTLFTAGPYGIRSGQWTRTSARKASGSRRRTWMTGK